MRSSRRRASSGSPQCSPRLSPLLQHCLFGYVWIYGAATAFYVVIHVFSMLRSAISVFSTFNFRFSTPFFFLAVLLLLDNQFSFRMLPVNSYCSMGIPYRRSACRKQWNQWHDTSNSSTKRFCHLSSRRLRSSPFDSTIPNNPRTIGQGFRLLTSVSRVFDLWLPRFSVASAFQKLITRQFLLTPPPAPSGSRLYRPPHFPLCKASPRRFCFHSPSSVSPTLRPPLVSSLSSVPSPIHSSSSTCPFGSLQRI
jgi:hypothetical protein